MGAVGIDWCINIVKKKASAHRVLDMWFPAPEKQWLPYDFPQKRGIPLNMTFYTRLRGEDQQLVGDQFNFNLFTGLINATIHKIQLHLQDVGRNHFF